MKAPTTVAHVEVRQPVRRSEVDDVFGTTAHGRDFPQEHAKARPVSFPSEPERRRCCQYIRGQRRRSFQGFERSGTCAGLTPLCRYRKFGGEWRVSDTAKAKSAKSTSLLYALQLSCEQGTDEFVSGIELKNRCVENKKSFEPIIY